MVSPTWSIVFHLLLVYETKVWFSRRGRVMEKKSGGGETVKKYPASSQTKQSGLKSLVVKL